MIYILHYTLYIQKTICGMIYRLLKLNALNIIMTCLNILRGFTQ